jgi:hypothetical protein
MDEEVPIIAYTPYKGPASIPHVPAEFFGAFFLGINVSRVGRGGSSSSSTSGLLGGDAR